MTAFWALLHRDLYVTGKNAVFLIMGTMTQPILVVLVFGNILPRLGLVAPEFRAVMLPGLMSISILMAGVQGVLMPLSIDLSGSREVDERVLTPLGIVGVAFGKVVAGAVHASVAGLLALPVMIFLMAKVSGMTFTINWVALLPLVVMSGFLSAAFGLTLGTSIQPRFSGLLFAIVLGPMMMFGCAYYPWAALKVIGVLQCAFLLNPLVFMSEAMRVAVTPAAAHMPPALLLTGLVGFTAFFTVIGARSFERRTIA